MASQTTQPNRFAAPFTEQADERTDEQPTEQSTGLLISVRNATEARLVRSLPLQLAAVIKVIDLKEPNSGALGRASCQTAHRFLEAVGPHAKSSVALGELRDWNPMHRPALPTGFQFAKLGLAGSAAVPNWHQQWRTALNSLPRETARVAVVYLDHQQCDAPAPEQIIEYAADAGCRGVLFDTHTKSAGSFHDHQAIGSLKSLLQSVHSNGLFSVLAGSVTTDNLPIAIGLNPTLIGVRGAVCAQDRRGSVCTKELTSFCQAFHTARKTLDDTA